MSSNFEKQHAAAVGGKTARACDNCLLRRARWYCAADDAFLCQPCDATVHSANPLARRHHRVRLNTTSGAPAATASFSSLQDARAGTDPAWLHGFKRKTRTPRGKPAGAGGAIAAAGKVEPLVPDLEAMAAEESRESDEEQLLYCVPIFDPDLAEFCCPTLTNEANFSFEETKPQAPQLEHRDTVLDAAADGFAGFHSTEMDLAKFAEDIDILLGRELENNNSSYINDLGLIGDSNKVKLELDDVGMTAGELDGAAKACGLDMEINLTTATFDLGFGCGTPAMISTGAAEEARAAPPDDAAAVVSDEFGVKAMILKLDYEAVISAWSSKVCSPWTDGHRPQLNPGDCLQLLGMLGDGGELQGACAGQMTGIGDGGREAKVTRYREKRRTRLFSKKIRYEVRKLNAEKRPRLKGRFVKRAGEALLPAAAAAAGGMAPLIKPNWKY